MKHTISLIQLIVLATCGSTSTAAPGDAVWSYMTGDAVVSSPVIGADGEVVFGSRDATLYALHPDGSLKWTNTSAQDWIETAPVIADDGTVYIGSWDQHIYAIDGSNGALKWSFATGSIISCPVALAAGGSTVVAASEDGLLYGLNTSGELQWFYAAAEWFDAYRAGPVVGLDGTTVFAGNESGQLHAVDGRNGQWLWTFSVPDIDPPVNGASVALLAAPAIGDDGTIYLPCMNGKLYAVTSAGELLWSFAATDGLSSSPVIAADGTIIFAGRDGYLYFVDGNGFQVGEQFIGDVFYSSPALDAAGNVVVAGYSGSSASGISTTVAAYDSNATAAWSFTIAYLNDSSPNITTDGHVLIGANDGMLYKLDHGHTPATSAWPRLLANRRNSGTANDHERNDLIDRFPTLDRVVNGTVTIPWFSDEPLLPVGADLWHHPGHGTIAIPAGTPSGQWLYDFTASTWRFATRSPADHYYSPADATWWWHLRHAPATTDDRWFINQSTGEWAAFPRL
jgi:outer membrane protein assembly factor BamB